MPKVAKALTALEVKRLGAGFHPVGGAPGLALIVRESGARSWILRTMVGGKRRDIGLGSYPEVTLARAREKAAQTKDAVRQGVDPVAERKADREALMVAQSKHRTFRQCAEAVLARKTAEFRNEKHAAQWRSTLDTYAHPLIGNLEVNSIELPLILTVLDGARCPKCKRLATYTDDQGKGDFGCCPKCSTEEKPVSMEPGLWHTRTETATRLRQRIESVLAYAIASGYRNGDNPARWKGNLDAILPKPAKLKKVQHHKALEVDDVPAFWTKLQGQDGMGAQALQFAILTAARSGEVRGARWDEFDLKALTWNVPGDRMKAGKEHVVPLSPGAVAILKALPRDNDLVFPAPRGGMLSDMTLTAVLKRMDVQKTVHGMRASFKDWATERTPYRWEVIEAALAHALGALEKAYRRTDLLDKRRDLMGDWQRFIEGRTGAKVTPIRKAK